MYIKVTVTPGAKREALRAVSETKLEISVKEPAERNLANTRVRELVAGHFKVRLGDVRIISGHRSHSKFLSIGE